MSFLYFRLAFLLIFLCLNSWTGCDNQAELEQESVEEEEDDMEQETAEEVKIAFIGDQGLSEEAVLVLNLIRDEGAEIVFHQGDLDYTNDPEAWDQQINDVLGEDFPYFVSVGNHDVTAWDGYEEKIEARLNRISDLNCEGSAGVDLACSYRSLFFINSGIGTLGDDEEHLNFLEDRLSATSAVWRICSWHKNQRLMQVGGKEDEVGWEAYEVCREEGAIIATAHEHSYSRTYLMSSFENQEIASESATLSINEGNTFAFVSGLGGASIREQDDTLAENPWWASVYTADQGANYGALFCTLNEGEIEGEGSCYFKDIDGSVPDSFNIIRGP